jgi:serine/threonine-protein kinase
LTRGEDIRLYEKSTDCLEALGHHIKGLELFNEHTREDNERAREQFKAAIKLDPEFVTAWALLASTYLIDVQGGWSDSPSDSFKRAFELTQKAMKFDEQNAVVHAVLGTIYLYQRQHEQAITEGKQSITLNPNFPIGHTMLARTMLFSGRFEESIELIKKAMRLNPKLHPSWLSYMVRGYIFLGRDEEALEVVSQMEELPGGYPSIGVSIVYQQVGKEEKARAHMAEVLKINPYLSLESLKMVEPFKNPAHLQREQDILRKARMPERAPNAVQEKPSIAVLPFANISGDPEQEYFADGMTEELIGALAKLEGLKVISRTSAFYFKGKEVKLRQVAEELKVDNVLEGSVRKAGNKLRISAQLIKVDDDAHLWAETYDRELKDVFAIQDEISKAVVQNLKVKLLGEKTEPIVKDYTKNIDAYELFLKGKYFAGKGPLGFEKVIEYMEKAIQADPDYAPAYATLAGIHDVMRVTRSLPPWEMTPKINALRQKAFALADNYGLTYVSLARKKMYEYDWHGAESDLKRALELNPGESACHINYSNYLGAVGRMDEAILEARHAVELDPLSIVNHFWLGYWLFCGGQVDQATKVLQETRELDANNYWASLGLAMIWAEKGMYDEGISILQQFRNIPLITGRLGYLYGKAGNMEEMQKIIDDFLDRSRQGYFSPYLIACVYSGLGEKDKVFEWLDRAYEVQDPVQWLIKVDYSFHSLHSDPRWADQMKKRVLAD